MTSCRLRCRQITAADFAVVLDLLGRGFPERPRSYWVAALGALEARRPPEGCARFGYLLEADETAAGVHIVICNEPREASDGEIRCHASAWYVEPAYRSHAALLASLASRQKQVTYLNTTAAPHTWATLSAVGYRRYTQGQFAAAPALSRGPRGRVTAFGSAHAGLPEHRLLAAHAALGCLSIVCETDAGRQPFVFLRRRVRRAPVGVAQLVWCRDTADFVASAGSIGRWLLGQGVSCVLLDADGPVPGLVGRYFPDRNPRFFKGPNQPRANDLAFSETVLLEAWASSPAREHGALGSTLATSRPPALAAALDLP